MRVDSRTGRELRTNGRTLAGPLTLAVACAGLGWAPAALAAPGRHVVAFLGLVGFVAVSLRYGREVKARERAERRLEVLLRHGGDMVAVVDADWAVSYVSDAATELLGFTPDELRGTSFLDLGDPDDVGRHRSVRDGDPSFEARLRRKDGSVRRCTVHMTDLRDDPLVGGVVLDVRDVTERRMLEEQLRDQALHDDLTGLAEPRLFADRLERGVVRQWRSGEPMAVLLVDLDDLEVVDDAFGHEAALAEVARRLVGCVRATDTVARLGDHEFGLVLEECTDRAEVDEVCDRILRSLADGGDVHGRRLPSRASIGAVMAEPWLSSAPALLRHAGAAVGAAKGRGERRVAWYEPGMDSLLAG